MDSRLLYYEDYNRSRCEVRLVYLIFFSFFKKIKLYLRLIALGRFFFIRSEIT